MILPIALIYLISAVSAQSFSFSFGADGQKFLSDISNFNFEDFFSSTKLSSPQTPDVKKTVPLREQSGARRIQPGPVREPANLRSTPVSTKQRIPSSPFSPLHPITPPPSFHPTRRTNAPISDNRARASPNPREKVREEVFGSSVRGVLDHHRARARGAAGANREAARNTPVRNRNTPSENRNTPSENRNTHSENRNTHSENRNTPSENRNTPSENRNIPSENRNTNAENVSSRGRVQQQLVITEETAKPQPSAGATVSVKEKLVGHTICARGTPGDACRQHLSHTAQSCTSGFCKECQKCGTVSAEHWPKCCREHFLCCRPLARGCQTCENKLLNPFCRAAFGRC